MSDKLIDRVLRDPRANRQLLHRLTRMEYAGHITVDLKGVPVTLYAGPLRKIKGRLVRCG